jgi:hypothetical protein
MIFGIPREEGIEGNAVGANLRAIDVYQRIVHVEGIGPPGISDARVGWLGHHQNL